MTDTYATMEDFSADEEYFYFNINGEWDEFWVAVEALKDGIHWKERSWDDGEELWTIARTAKNEDALRQIFFNGAQCCDSV